jgi:hypothetical protein
MCIDDFQISPPIICKKNEENRPVIQEGIMRRFRKVFQVQLEKNTVKRPKFRNGP